MSLIYFSQFTTQLPWQQKWHTCTNTITTTEYIFCSIAFCMLQIHIKVKAYVVVLWCGECYSCRASRSALLSSRAVSPTSQTPTSCLPNRADKYKAKEVVHARYSLRWCGQIAWFKTLSHSRGKNINGVWKNSITSLLIGLLVTPAYNISLLSLSDRSYGPRNQVTKENSLVPFVHQGFNYKQNVQSNVLQFYHFDDDEHKEEKNGIRCWKRGQGNEGGNEEKERDGQPPLPVGGSAEVGKETLLQ